MSSNEKQVQRVQRIAPVFPVRDVLIALEHYKKLGFETKAYGERTPEGKAIYGFLTHGAVEMHLSLFADLDPKANTSAAYLYVQDANALHAEWVSAGVSGRFEAPTDQPYGLREFVHVDPDGNLLRVGSELAR